MSPYNTDGVPRPWEERLKDAYLGVLAEKLIRKYLRTEFGQAANVDSEPYTTYDEHVDIKINWHTGRPNDQRGQIFICVWEHVKSRL